MGKGDKKTKRGKITKGSYGVRRPRKKQKAIIKAAPKVKKTAEKPKPAAMKKAAPKKTDKK